MTKKIWTILALAGVMVMAGKELHGDGILELSSDGKSGNYTIKSPVYRLNIQCSETQGFKQFTAKVKEKPVFSGTGLSLMRNKNVAFNAGRMPLVIKIKDEKGVKELQWIATTSDLVDYSGKITARPNKISFRQEWVYKKNAPDISCRFSIPLNPEVVQGAPYLITYDDLSVNQSTLEKIENAWKVYEDGKSFLKELIFYTNIGNLNYRVSSENIIFGRARIVSAENKQSPAHPYLDVAVHPYIVEAGGKAGEKRAVTMEIEISP